MPDTGTLRGDLIVLGDNVAGLLAGPRTAPVAGAILAAAPCRRELARLGSAFFANRLAREQQIFQRAVRRGELAPDADPNMIMDLLAGALWLRLILRGEPMPDDFVVALVDAILTGVGAAG